MGRQMVVDYVISLTHLYGLVHKSKVVDIYNMQNSEQITEMSLYSFQPEDLEAKFEYIQGDYFIHEAFLDKEYFEEELRARVGKPFYIPPQEELLNYLDDDYFDNEKEYGDLFDYVTKNFFPDDEDKAYEFCCHVQDMCKAAWPLPRLLRILVRGIIS